MIDILTTNFFHAKRRNVKIKLNSFDAMPNRLVGDKMRIIQVSNNLVSNAVAYAIKDKTVTINCTYESETSNLEVSVSGNSNPIDASRNLFEQASNNDRGTSLSVCKKILDKLEGTINYRSSLAGETIFYFRLPCRTAEG